MTTPFLDVMAAALTQALGVIGADSFTIVGYEGSFSGHYDPGSASRTVGGPGKPGFKGEHSAKILAGIAQFSAVEAPVERTLANKRLTVRGIEFRIGNVQADALSVTLYLTTTAAE